MDLLKTLPPLLFLLFILQGCKPEPQPIPAPDLNALSGNYLVAGTHFNWYYSGTSPVDSVVQNTYYTTNDTLTIGKVNDTTINALLSDSVPLFSTQLTYKGHSSATGGYIFLWGHNGGPDYDSLVLYSANPDSVYFSFSANLPHSVGDTYQMRGPKMH